jgi:hypothetical protein
MLTTSRDPGCTGPCDCPVRPYDHEQMTVQFCYHNFISLQQSDGKQFRDPGCTGPCDCPVRPYDHEQMTVQFCYHSFISLQQSDVKQSALRGTYGID